MTYHTFKRLILIVVLDVLYLISIWMLTIGSCISFYIDCYASMEEIRSACQDACNGLPSRRPVMEMTIPSSLDNTISPPGMTSLQLRLIYSDIAIRIII